MFDVWYGDIETTTLALVLSVFVLLPIQILLCFKVRSKAVRLLPVIALSILTMGFLLIAVVSTGWDGLGYIFLAIFSGIMLLACVIGWAIWAIIKRIRQKR